jgi:hypothetical protein
MTVHEYNLFRLITLLGAAAFTYLILSIVLAMS